MNLDNIRKDRETATESYIRQGKLSTLQEALLRESQHTTELVNQYNSIVAKVTKDLKEHKKNISELKPFIFNLKNNGNLVLDYFPGGNMSNPKQVEILPNKDYVLIGGKISYTRGGEILNIDDLALHDLQRFISNINIITTY